MNTSEEHLSREIVELENRIDEKATLVQEHLTAGRDNQALILLRECEDLCMEILKKCTETEDPKILMVVDAVALCLEAVQDRIHEVSYRVRGKAS